MAIDPSLLTKAAKVYEAAESVEGMKPKEVYESHKKCAPGEFGMNKEGGTKQAALNDALGGALGLGGVGALGGAGIGGLYGLLSGAHQSPRGKKMRGALSGMARGAGGGALVGGGLGAGAGAGIAIGVPKGLVGAKTDDHPAIQELNKDPIKYLSRILGGGALGAAAGGGIGAATAHTVFDDKKEKKDDKDMKKESAYAFGGRVKQSLDPAVGYGAAGGGLLGAGLGGLAGLINPGEEEDETGRVRRRSRFGAALRGALGGGAAGALGGGALGYLQPNSVNNLTQRLQQMFAGSKPGARLPDPLVNRGGEMQTPDEYRGMLNDNLFYNPKNPTLNVPNAQSGNYMPEYGTPGGRIGPSVR